MDLSSIDLATYVPLDPIDQYKGTDPLTGVLTYYQMDANGFIVAKFISNAWVDFHTLGLIDKPQDLSPAVDTSDQEKIAQNMVDSGLFKPRTSYIIIGDEPDSAADGVIDLATNLNSNDLSNFKQYLTLMPRQMLHDFFMKSLWPSLPWKWNVPASDGVPSDAPLITDPIYGGTHYKKTCEDMVWAALIDLFNEANLQYVNDNKLDPWDWENQKLNAYYVSTNQSAIDSLNKDIDQYKDLSLALDPKAQSIMEEFMALDKLGDVGLEITRQNAVKELLKQQEYDTAQAIVDAYKFVQNSPLGDTLTKPIPYDIVDASGNLIAQNSSGQPSEGG